jgi:hypothetical protein
MVFIFPSSTIIPKEIEILKKDLDTLPPEKAQAILKQCEEISAELGDCCWFIAALSYEIGFDLGLVMEQNIDKLADRAKRGVIGGSGDNR